MPSLFSFFPPLNPGVPLSTMKAVALLRVRGPPVLATTTTVLPLMPWVIQFFVPLSTHSSPSLTAVQLILPASLPVPASVSPHAPSASPEARAGRYFCFCASDPHARMWPVQRELWAARLNPIPPHTLEISTMIVTYSV